MLRVASVLHKAFSRWVIGTPRTSVYSFRIQLPMPSRPSAVDRLRVFNLFNTESVSVKLMLRFGYSRISSRRVEMFEVSSGL